MVVWHKQTHAVYRTHNVKPSSIFFSFFFFCLLFFSVIFVHSTLKLQPRLASRTRINVMTRNVFDGNNKVLNIESPRARTVNGSILFLNRNFKADFDIYIYTYIKKKNPRELFHLEPTDVREVWRQGCLTQTFFLHTHCYSPCRFSDTDL